MYTTILAISLTLYGSIIWDILVYCHCLVTKQAKRFDIKRQVLSVF